MLRGSMSLIKCILCVFISSILWRGSTGNEGSPDHHNRPSRSVGGQDVSNNQYPFMASIRNSGGHICGGSIISANIILTAAHCVKDVFLDLLYVKVGDVDINYKGLWFQVEKVLRHENFRENHLSELESEHPVNDVALLKLNQSISLDNITTKAIELFGENEDVHDHRSGILVGWGDYRVIKKVDDDDNSSETQYEYVQRAPSILRSVKLNIGGILTCVRVYPTADLEGQFCTYTLGKVFCEGDSGSPFIVNGKQAGITSWANECNLDSNAAYFVEVADFHDWIVEKMNLLQKE